MSEASAVTDAVAPGDPQPTTVHPAFAWKRSKSIPSLNLTMVEYEHRATGALHYHLSSDNPENVFLVAFRTVPMDSTGVAHILEHTALCGSEQFPVRDPFFMMIRRSLNTFMNAFTSSDWTAYPFASKNTKDFNNLLSVYLDAAFFSRLHPLDFAQEGHRLEFAVPDNAESELEYKGVVFNEMKGAMSSTNSVLWQTMSKYIFPTTTYHFNSGGEPDHIPDLSYQSLLDFYRSHYHPSNAVFMTYGDLPANRLHEQFESLALGRFEKLDVNIAVGNEKRFLAPIRVAEYYAADTPDQAKTHVVIGWLLGKSTDLGELFRAQLLSSVLLDNSACPLMKALETSSLGSSPSPMCGLEDSSREMTFMAGLEGCEVDAGPPVEELVLDTLNRIKNDGIPLKQVEAALHQLELNQREISGDSYPYGLQLILTGLSTAMHRGDPIMLLDIDPVLAELREAIKQESFIPGLIDQLLLNNPHRVTLTLNPDDQLAARKADAERASLEAIRQSLNPEQVEEILQRSQALLARQAEEDDPDLLPKVGLEDVPAELQEPSKKLSLLSSAQSDLSFYGQGTNGLAYQQIVFDLPMLEQGLLEALPLYTSCLTEFGIGDKDYEEVQTWQARISGGVNCFSSLRSDIRDVQQIKALLTFSSKSLVGNHSQLCELLVETVTAVRFDEEQRLLELVEQICARKESSITGQGHSLAMNLASSGMSPSARLTHNFGGLAGIKRLQQLRDALREGDARASLLRQFAALHNEVLAAPRQFLLIAEPEQEQTLCDDLRKHWSLAPPASEFQPLSLPTTREDVKEAWTTSTQVNFCAKAFPTVPAHHEDNAVLHVLAGFLRNGFLHRAIREQGGAYGGGAGQDANSASFRFFSYRDPRLQATLEDFDRSIEWVVDGRHGAHQLEEAILGVIATMDKPSSPAGEAKQAFYNELFGRSLEQRMAFRRRVLATSMADLKAVAERYFTPEQASIGVISSRDQEETLGELGLSIIKI